MMLYHCMYKTGAGEGDYGRVTVIVARLPTSVQLELKGVILQIAHGLLTLAICNGLYRN